MCVFRIIFVSLKVWLLIFFSECSRVLFSEDFVLCKIGNAIKRDLSEDRKENLHAFKTEKRFAYLMQIKGSCILTVFLMCHKTYKSTFI